MSSGGTLRDPILYHIEWGAGPPTVAVSSLSSSSPYPPSTPASLRHTSYVRVPGPTHATLARDQFAALAACLVPRCGGGSPARALPQPALAEWIGRRWVLRLRRRAAVSVRADSFVAADPRLQDATAGFWQTEKVWGHVGVSETLGLCYLSWTPLQWCERMDIGWAGRGLVVESVGQQRLAVVTSLSERKVVCEVMRISDPQMAIFVNTGDWVVLYPGCDEKMALWPISWFGGEIRPKIVKGPWKGIDQATLLWMEKLEGNKVVLVNKNNNHRGGSELCIVDLKTTYESGELYVVSRIQGYSASRPAWYSTRYPVITLSRRKAPDTGAVKWQLTTKGEGKAVTVLRTCESRPQKVDSCHFLEIPPMHNTSINSSNDTNNGAGNSTELMTLNLFSTEDFAKPCHVFHIGSDTAVECGNGLIAFQGESYVDIYDAVTAAWLLRQPTPPRTCPRSLSLKSL